MSDPIRTPDGLIVATPDSEAELTTARAAAETMIGDLPGPLSLWDLPDEGAPKPPTHEKTSQRRGGDR